MEFRILGAIEVVADGGEEVPLGGSRSRALLASLLVEPGHAVSRESLIDGLWAAPPASASHAVEVYASRLRRVLGAGRIRSRGHAYRMELEPDELDLACLRKLARDGRSAIAGGDAKRAAGAYGEALAIWRGEPVACLNGEPVASHLRGCLEEERLAVIEGRLDARLALGADEELLPELRHLVFSHPTRERLWGRLMLALYRSGRQIESLAVYRRLHAQLRAELGLEPGPELRELQRRILAQDPRLFAWSGRLFE